MKLRRLAITNIASYRERTEFLFDTGITILIGPNGGGKTNLQRIIALALSKYFIHQYQFRRDDTVTAIEVVDPWTQPRALQAIFPRYVKEDGEAETGDQLIEIDLVVESRDIENIKAIGTNLERFNEELGYWERKYSDYRPYALVDRIAAGQGLSFTIRNLRLEEPAHESAAWVFQEYLREFFIFMRVVNRISEVTLSSPVFFFSSDRTLNKRFLVEAGNLTEQAYFDGFRSAYQAAMGDSVNMMQWGAQHFVRLFREAVIDAAKVKDKVWEDFFLKFDDVRRLSRYLHQMGYKWDFKTDADQLSYAFVLIREGRVLSTEMFSSGEREITHFLLAMFALNVRDGLILVDEPELHLHPRWQRIFLDLFREIAPDRNDQFIVSTHSPTFVTPETIDSVTRIFYTATGSRRVSLREVDLPEKKNLVRMINSQNNERLFFADKVVLVEGISDRLVVQSILEGIANRFDVTASIEVIEVGGKNNFKDYVRLLNGLLTPTYVVADRDYLANIGSTAVRALFTGDSDKQWRVLTEDKKSTDRAALISLLRAAIESGDVTELTKFWDYFSARISSLKGNLSEDEQQSLEADHVTHAEQQVYVLRAGEIEDYLPPPARDMRGIVELVSDPSWINSLPEEAKRVELGQIGCAIIGIKAEANSALLEELRKGVAVLKRREDAKAEADMVQKEPSTVST